MDYKKIIRQNIIIQILLFIILLVIDRLTKYWAVQVLKAKTSIVLIPNILEFRYLENKGAAFGFLQNQQWLFYIITAFVLAVIVYFWIRIIRLSKSYITIEPEKFHKKTLMDRSFLNYILVFLAAGAVGNLIDRITHNYVVDFIYFKLINFPIFNFADICVSLSAVILVVFFIFVFKEDPEFVLLGGKK